MSVVTWFIFSMQCDLEPPLSISNIFLLPSCHPIDAQISSSSSRPSYFTFISFSKVSQKAVSTQDVTSAVSLPLFCCMKYFSPLLQFM